MKNAINEVRDDSDKLWLTVQNKGNNPEQRAPDFPPTLDFMGNHCGDAVPSCPSIN